MSQAPRLLRCKPIVRNAAGQEVPRGPDADGPPPFHCCVRIERLRMQGARRTDSGIQPVRLTVQAPLTLRNTLPLDVGWTLTASN